MNPITLAIEKSGLQKIAAACGVSYQAVRKWESKGTLPRTEWTGETRYADAISTATNGAISPSTLRPDLYPKSLFKKEA